MFYAFLRVAINLRINRHIYKNVCFNLKWQMLTTQKHTMIREQIVITNINMYIYYYVLY